MDPKDQKEIEVFQDSKVYLGRRVTSAFLVSQVLMDRKETEVSQDPWAQ